MERFAEMVLGSSFLLEGTLMNNEAFFKNPDGCGLFLDDPAPTHRTHVLSKWFDEHLYV